LFYTFIFIKRNIIEKLKKLKITTFQTVEDIFRIEFPKSVTTQTYEENRKIEQIFSGIKQYFYLLQNIYS
jgi:hypothetical protein